MEYHKIINKQYIVWMVSRSYIEKSPKTHSEKQEKRKGVDKLYLEVLTYALRGIQKKLRRERLKIGKMVTSRGISRPEAYTIWGSFFKKKNVKV